MRANIVKNLANSPLLPSIFALLARIVILNLYRLELIGVPLSPNGKLPFGIHASLMVIPKPQGAVLIGKL
jgi:hypothetical protein